MLTSKLKLLPLLAILFLSSCEKEEVIPKYTESGENTFAAYVNGELWIPRGRPQIFKTSLTYNYYPEDEVLSIEAFRKKEPEGEYINVNLMGVDGEGVYSFQGKEQTITFSGVCHYSGGYGNNEYVYRDGTLEITKLDTVNWIIAGKFEATLHKAGCDTLRITEGRFDFKL